MARKAIARVAVGLALLAAGASSLVSIKSMKSASERDRTFFTPSRVAHLAYYVSEALQGDSSLSVSDASGKVVHSLSVEYAQLRDNYVFLNPSKEAWSRYSSHRFSSAHLEEKFLIVYSPKAPREFMKGCTLVEYTGSVLSGDYERRELLRYAPWLPNAVRLGKEFESSGFN